ncbi:MAG: hypothetical protein KGJ02_01025 [Verrucomicrobiota bacterium]|nr:hypothetical protein [Verrucomicrobiota bacterium]
MLSIKIDNHPFEILRTELPFPIREEGQWKHFQPDAEIPSSLLLTVQTNRSLKKKALEVVTWEKFQEKIDQLDKLTTREQKTVQGWMITAFAVLALVAALLGFSLFYPGIGIALLIFASTCWAWAAAYGVEVKEADGVLKREKWYREFFKAPVYLVYRRTFLQKRIEELQKSIGQELIKQALFFQNVPEDVQIHVEPSSHSHDVYASDDVFRQIRALQETLAKGRALVQKMNPALKDGE